MYGLPQAGILANELLQKNLAKFGYYQCKHTPGIWKHKTRPIVFVLVVDYFGVKYVGKEHVMHLLKALKKFYKKISIDWEGKLFCGIKLQWDYKNKHVDLSIPGYIHHVLHKYHHNPSQRKQYAPYPYQQIIYGKNYKNQHLLIILLHSMTRIKNMFNNSLDHCYIILGKLIVQCWSR